MGSMAPAIRPCLVALLVVADDVARPINAVVVRVVVNVPYHVGVISPSGLHMAKDDVTSPDCDRVVDRPDEAGVVRADEGFQAVAC